MRVLRKYARFHDNNAADMEVFDAVSNYRKYGFRSESQMIMEALRHFLSNKLSDCTPEQLADMIADRLQERIPISHIETPVPENNSIESDDAMYQAALSFLDTL